MWKMANLSKHDKHDHENIFSNPEKMYQINAMTFFVNVGPKFAPEIPNTHKK